MNLLISLFISMSVHAASEETWSVGHMFTGVGSGYTPNEAIAEGGRSAREKTLSCSSKRSEPVGDWSISSHRSRNGGCLNDDRPCVRDPGDRIYIARRYYKCL